MTRDPSEASVVPVDTARRKRWPWIAGGLLATAALVAVTFNLLSPEEPPRGHPPAREHQKSEVPASQEAGTGALEINGSTTCKVFVDDQYLGDSPGHWTVPVGTHSVRVFDPSAGTNRAMQFSVKAGATFRWTGR